jgi:hypothetical protein
VNSQHFRSASACCQRMKAQRASPASRRCDRPVLPFWRFFKVSYPPITQITQIGAVARPSGRASSPRLTMSGNQALPDGRATAPINTSQKRPEMPPKFLYSDQLSSRLVACRSFLFKSNPQPPTEQPRISYVRPTKYRLEVVKKQLVGQILNVELKV